MVLPIEMESGDGAGVVSGCLADARVPQLGLCLRPARAAPNWPVMPESPHLAELRLFCSSASSPLASSSARCWFNES